MDTNKTKKLSPAQQRFMDELNANGGSSNPPWGYKSAGRDASCWHRTARSLQNLGLLKVLRNGRGHRAEKT